MFIKLTLSGLKGKSRDYLILFTGLMLAISVFYMFLTLAMNKEFITSNSVINSIQLVFIIGTLLLSVVTFFYILYTNSFLLSFKQKEYGMYMLLGAKKKKINRILLIETMIIAVASIFIGIIIGILLSWGVSLLLMNQLDIQLIGFKPLYLPAILLAVLYFCGSFYITYLLNHYKLSKMTILDLLHSNIQPHHVPVKQKGQMILIIIGLLSLSIGYVALLLMEYLTYVGLFIAPIFTTLGTYLLFDALLPILVRAMKNTTSRSLKGIYSFTFSQLSFRIDELKRILATIVMLIALSAGAISGGFAFKNNVPLTVDENYIYDTVLYNPDDAEKEILQAIPFTEQIQYRFKIHNSVVYYPREDLVVNPPLIEDWITYEIRRAEELPLVEGIAVTENGSQLFSDDWVTAFETINPALGFENKVVSLESFEQINKKEEVILIGKTENFFDYLNEWKRLDELQMAKYPELILGFDPKFDTIPSKYAYSLKRYAFASGTFFMGFFLGLAFLTMMASTLMFKILTGATKDIQRYEILRKLGVRTTLLASSISKEIGLVFLFPALLGLLHVIIGINLFSFIMIDPYAKFWISILLFLVIYVSYYFLTVYMYKKIVLPRQ